MVTSTSAEIGRSPAQVLFGRATRDGIAPAKPRPTDQDESVQKHLEEARRGKVVRQQQRRRGRAAVFREGQDVLVQDRRKKWSRPGVIVQAASDRSYVVEMADDGAILRRNEKYIKEVRK